MLNGFIFFCGTLVALFIAFCAFVIISVKKEIDIIQPDILKSKMIEYENKIDSFYGKYKLNNDSSLNDIAGVLNIVVGKYDNNLNNTNIQAQTVFDKNEGKNIVNFKLGLNEEERNFYFAHECAHLINNDPLPCNRPDSLNKSSIEQRADYMASAILMPKEKIIEALKHENYNDLDKRKKLKIIDKIAKEYTVPYIAALRRVNEVLELEN